MRTSQQLELLHQRQRRREDTMARHSSKRQSLERQSHGDLSVPEGSEISAEARRAMIAEAAYYLSEQRAAAGLFSDEMRDWLDAERTIDQQIAPVLPARHQHGQSLHA